MPRDLSDCLIIRNEGGFTHGTASLDIYFPSSKTLYSDYFKARNGFPLGDVFQSIARDNTRLFLVINNSHKIEVVDGATLTHIATVENLVSPRYLFIASATKAYCSNYGGSQISKIDLNSYKQTASIKAPYWNERWNYIYSDSGAYLLGVKTDKLYYFSAETDSLSDSLSVGKEPQWIVQNHFYAHCWVLCSAAIKTEPAELDLVDASTFSLSQRFSFGSLRRNPSSLQINGTQDTLYWLEADGIYRMAEQASSLPAQSWIPARGKNFYGLSIDYKTGDIYATDAIDYVQRGFVYRYSRAGTLLDSFRAGVIPAEAYRLR